MSKGNLILSREHGLNPCIAECYVCGQSKNEILLTGKAGERVARKHFNRADGRMPMQAVFDLEPCDACRAAGVSLIEMTEESPNAQPTGYRVLIKEDALRRMCEREIVEHMVRARMAFLTPEVWDKLGLPRGNELERSEEL